jgi:short-subunit dehydrogenase
MSTRSAALIAGASVYGATKAFVLFLSQGFSLELVPKGRSHKTPRRPIAIK